MSPLGHAIRRLAAFLLLEEQLCRKPLAEAARAFADLEAQQKAKQVSGYAAATTSSAAAPAVARVPQRPSIAGAVMLLATNKSWTKMPKSSEDFEWQVLSFPVARFPLPAIGVHVTACHFSINLTVAPKLRATA